MAKIDGLSAQIRASLRRTALCDDTDPADACPVSVGTRALAEWWAAQGLYMEPQAASYVGDFTESIACDVLVPKASRAAESVPAFSALQIGEGPPHLFTTEGLRSLLASRGQPPLSAAALAWLANGCETVMEALVACARRRSGGNPVLTSACVRAAAQHASNEVASALAALPAAQ